VETREEPELSEKIVIFGDNGFLDCGLINLGHYNTIKNLTVRPEDAKQELRVQPELVCRVGLQCLSLSSLLRLISKSTL